MMVRSISLAGELVDHGLSVVHRKLDVYVRMAAREPGSQLERSGVIDVYANRL